MKGKIKSFSVWKTAKIGALVLASIPGLLITSYLIWLALFRAIRGFPPTGSHSIRFLDVLALLALACPFYGIVGFILTAIASWLYNVLSPRFGGIEIEIADSN